MTDGAENRKIGDRKMTADAYFSVIFLSSIFLSKAEPDRLFSFESFEILTVFFFASREDFMRPVVQVVGGSLVAPRVGR